MMNAARIDSAVSGMTLASTAYQNALAYARERIRGVDSARRKPGHVPIIDHPDVRRMLHYLALIEFIAAIIRAYCPEMGFRVCETAIQVLEG